MIVVSSRIVIATILTVVIVVITAYVVYTSYTTYKKTKVSELPKIPENVPKPSGGKIVKTYNFTIVIIPIVEHIPQILYIPDLFYVQTMYCYKDNAFKILLSTYYHSQNDVLL